MQASPSFQRPRDYDAMNGASLRRLANKCVACRLHNADTWRGIARRTEAIGHDRRLMDAHDLALIVNAFKRIATAGRGGGESGGRSGLLSPEWIARTATERMEEFTSDDLALMALSYAGIVAGKGVRGAAGGAAGGAGLLMSVADKVCQWADEGRPPREVTAWMHLVGALAKANVPHQASEGGRSMGHSGDSSMYVRAY